SFTGYKGRWPTPEDREHWRSEGLENIALRLPPVVIGLDVDHYEDKHGADTLATLEAQLGALPRTWISTSRTDGVSGIRLYRVPAGVEGWPTQAGPDIEIVRYAHRYMMVWPAVHPLGGIYRWYKPDGTQAKDG